MEYSGPPPFQPPGPPPPPPGASSSPRSRRALIGWRVGVALVGACAWFGVQGFLAVFVVGFSADPVLTHRVWGPGAFTIRIMGGAVCVWAASMLPLLSSRVRLAMIVGSGVVMVGTSLGWLVWVLAHVPYVG